MSTDILQKCVDELKQEEPNIQYILGILETLIQVSGGSLTMQSSIPVVTFAKTVVSDNTNKNYDEKEEIPSALRPGPIAELRS